MPKRYGLECVIRGWEQWDTQTGPILHHAAASVYCSNRRPSRVLERLWLAARANAKLICQPSGSIRSLSLNSRRGEVPEIYVGNMPATPEGITSRPCGIRTYDTLIKRRGADCTQFHHHFETEPTNHFTTDLPNQVLFPPQFILRFGSCPIASFSMPVSPSRRPCVAGGRLRPANRMRARCCARIIG